MITFGEKLKYLSRKLHCKQKQLGTAVGFSEGSADVRIAQYESDQRTPRDDIFKRLARELGVPPEILTVPLLSEPKEYSAASFWMHELASKL